MRYKMELQDQVKFWVNGIKYGIKQFKYALKYHNKKGYTSLFFNILCSGYNLPLHSWVERDKWEEIECNYWATIYYCPITKLYWIMDGERTNVVKTLDEAIDIAKENN